MTEPTDLTEPTEPNGPTYPYEPPTVVLGSEIDLRKPTYLCPGVQGYAVWHSGENGIHEIYIPLIGGDSTGKVGRFLDSLSPRCVIVNLTSSRLEGMLVRRGWVKTMAETWAGECDEWRRVEASGVSGVELT